MPIGSVDVASISLRLCSHESTYVNEILPIGSLVGFQYPHSLKVGSPGKVRVLLTTRAQVHLGLEVRQWLKSVRRLHIL